eukprot:Sspe_Gene.105562::Locus_82604_Transcript_1_2_Confidence_0.667_Length_687::g.105562::m.105562
MQANQRRLKVLLRAQKSNQDMGTPDPELDAEIEALRNEMAGSPSPPAPEPTAPVASSPPPSSPPTVTPQHRHRKSYPTWMVVTSTALALLQDILARPEYGLPPLVVSLVAGAVAAIFGVPLYIGLCHLVLLTVFVRAAKPAEYPRRVVIYILRDWLQSAASAVVAYAVTQELAV